MQSGLCSQPMHSKAPGVRSSTCNWASHKSVHLHFALLQGGCGVKKSTDTTFLCREILLVCFTCLFPEELLPEEVSNSSLGCCVPFRRKLISPLKCSPSTARHMFSGHQPKEHSLQLLTYVPSWQPPEIFGEPNPMVLHLCLHYDCLVTRPLGWGTPGVHLRAASSSTASHLPSNFMWIGTVALLLIQVTK